MCRRVALAPRGRNRRAVLTRAWRGAGRAPAASERITREHHREPRHSRGDIKETLGLVQHFFSAIPDELLAPERQIFKRMELGQTLIPNKYKELIGLGLHAETSATTAPCFTPRRPSCSGRPTRRSRKRCTTPRRARAGARTSKACGGLRRLRRRAGANRPVPAVQGLIGDAGTGPADGAAGDLPRPRVRRADRGGPLRRGFSARRHACRVSQLRQLTGDYDQQVRQLAQDPHPSSR